MRFAGRRATLTVVGTPTVVITLELQVEEDSLTGRASDGDGGEREFAGWVGLMAALDELVLGATPAADV
jgi:hypothetical protein